MNSDPRRVSHMAQQFSERADQEAGPLLSFHCLFDNKSTISTHDEARQPRVVFLFFSSCHCLGAAVIPGDALAPSLQG